MDILRLHIADRGGSRIWVRGPRSARIIFRSPPEGEARVFQGGGHIFFRDRWCNNWDEIDKISGLNLICHGLLTLLVSRGVGEIDTMLFDIAITQLVFQLLIKKIFFLLRFSSVVSI